MIHPKISIIIPNYDRADALPTTLLALAAQSLSTEQFDVILVDDGSMDHSIEVIKQLTLPYYLRILQNQHQGPASARNTGAHESKADYFLFLDADMILTSGALFTFLAIFAQHPQALIVGRQMPWTDCYSERYIRTFYDAIAADLGRDSSPIPFHAVTTAILAIDRTSFEELNGFDPTFRMSEDVELGFRAFQAGMDILYDSSLIAYHNHPKTPQQLFEQTKTGARWAAYFMNKHPDALEQIPVYQAILPIRWGRDSLDLILRKFINRLYARQGCIRLFQWLMIFLYKNHLSLFLAARLRYRIEAGYRYQGFHQYMTEARSHQNASPLQRIVT